MPFLPEILTQHWLAAALLATAVIAACLGLLSRRWLTLAGGLALLAAGGLLLAGNGWAPVLAILGGLLLLGLLVLLFFSGDWWAAAAVGAVGIALLGLGGWGLDPFGVVLIDLGKSLLTLEFVHPWWLLLLF